MDDLLGFTVILILTACAFGLVVGALVFAAGVAALIVLVLLPFVVIGFVREWRAENKRRADDSNANP